MDSTICDFGQMPGGAAVQRLTLQAGALTARLLTYGAILQDLRLAGVPYSLTLGSENLADYLGPLRYHGALIGPVAGRIEGAKAQIGDRLCQFAANEGGRHCLHSGPTGSAHQIWQIEAQRPDQAVLRLTLPGGAGGFPGQRLLRARFTLLPPATLRLEVSAETDAATLMNIAQHSYWNLDGSPEWAGHSLQVFAGQFLPPDAQNLPPLAPEPVMGTAYDFRTPRAITPAAPPLDHNFCLAAGRGPLRPAAVLTGQKGLRLALHTTEPGLQVYDGRAAARPGRVPYEGLALEPQFWPNAPHRPGFPSILLQPGELWTQVSEWRFDRA